MWQWFCIDRWETSNQTNEPGWLKVGKATGSYQLMNYAEPMNVIWRDCGTRVYFLEGIVFQPTNAQVSTPPPQPCRLSYRWWRKSQKFLYHPQPQEWTTEEWMTLVFIWIRPRISQADWTLGSRGWIAPAGAISRIGSIPRLQVGLSIH